MAAQVVTSRVAPPGQRARAVHPRKLGAQRPAKLGVEPATKELRSTAGLLLIFSAGYEAASRRRRRQHLGGCHATGAPGGALSDT